MNKDSTPLLFLSCLISNLKLSTDSEIHSKIRGSSPFYLSPFLPLLFSLLSSHRSFVLSLSLSFSLSHVLFDLCESQDPSLSFLNLSNFSKNQFKVDPSRTPCLPLPLASSLCLTYSLTFFLVNFPKFRGKTPKFFEGRSFEGTWILLSLFHPLFFFTPPSGIFLRFEIRADSGFFVSLKVISSLVNYNPKIVARILTDFMSEPRPPSHSKNCEYMTLIHLYRTQDLENFELSPYMEVVSSSPPINIRIWIFPKFWKV